jgi:hypothetical protein
MLKLTDTPWYPNASCEVSANFSIMGEGFRGTKRNSFNRGKDR